MDVLRPIVDESEGGTTISAHLPISFDAIEHTQRHGTFLAEQNQERVEDVLRRREETMVSREEDPEGSEGPRGPSSRETSSSEGGRERRGRRRRRGDDSEEGVRTEMDTLRGLLSSHDNRVQQAIEAQKRCYGCNWFEGPKVDVEEVNAVTDVFCKKHGTMDDHALATLLENVFNRKIRDPYRRKGIPIPDWPAKTILEHFKYHMVDPDVMFTEIIRTFYMTFNEMKNGFFTERTIVHYSEDPERMNAETGEPIRYRHEQKHWECNTKVVRCAMDVYKVLKDAVKFGSSEYAPERKRARTKQLNPTMVCAERIQFGDR
jgi:hypothetical protein